MFVYAAVVHRHDSTFPRSQSGFNSRLPHYMTIRLATAKDIPKLALLERKAYGKQGYSEQFILGKQRHFPDGLIISEHENKITGYILYDSLGEHEISPDFRIVSLKEPIEGRWMHIVAFTTETNYKDFEHDANLLRTAEKSAILNGCKFAYVPLPKEHTFDKHGAHQFWERNGYRKIGSIQWLPESGKPVECYFYKKQLTG